MADSQGLGETMTGKERGYPMHTVSMPRRTGKKTGPQRIPYAYGIHTHPCPSIVLLYCYTFRQN